MNQVGDYLRDIWKGGGYLFSNIPLLFVGGLILAILNFSSYSIVGRGASFVYLSCLVLPVVLVVSLIFSGYQIMCMRSIYMNEIRIPSFFRDHGRIVGDSFTALILIIIWAMLSLPIWLILRVPVFLHWSATVITAADIVGQLATILMMYPVSIAMTIYVVNNRRLHSAHPSSVADVVRRGGWASVAALCLMILIDAGMKLSNYVFTYISPMFPSWYGITVVELYNIVTSWLSFFNIILVALIFMKLYQYVEGRRDVQRPSAESSGSSA